MEDEMAILKSLTFTTLTRATTNPTLDRRAKTIARIEEQKLLLDDPTYTRTVRTSVKKDGEKSLVEMRASKRRLQSSKASRQPDEGNRGGSVCPPLLLRREHRYVLSAPLARKARGTLCLAYL
jgi:hypothetical protein